MVAAPPSERLPAAETSWAFALALTGPVVSRSPALVVTERLPPASLAETRSMPMALR